MKTEIQLLHRLLRLLAFSLLLLSSTLSAEEPTPAQGPECRLVPVQCKPQPPPPNFQVSLKAEVPVGYIEYLYSDAAQGIFIEIGDHWCSQVILPGENGALLCSIGKTTWLQVLKEPGKEPTVEVCRVNEPPKPAEPPKSKVRA